MLPPAQRAVDGQKQHGGGHGLDAARGRRRRTAHEHQQTQQKMACRGHRIHVHRRGVEPGRASGDRLEQRGQCPIRNAHVRHDGRGLARHGRGRLLAGPPPVARFQQKQAQGRNNDEERG